MSRRGPVGRSSGAARAPDPVSVVEPAVVLVDEQLERAGPARRSHRPRVVLVVVLAGQPLAGDAGPRSRRRRSRATTAGRAPRRRRSPLTGRHHRRAAPPGTAGRAPASRRRRARRRPASAPGRARRAPGSPATSRARATVSRRPSPIGGAPGAASRSTAIVQPSSSATSRTSAALGRLARLDLAARELPAAGCRGRASYGGRPAPDRRRTIAAPTTWTGARRHGDDATAGMRRLPCASRG